MVLRREGNVNVYFFTDVLTDQLLLKGINEGMGTDDKLVVLALAACKRYTVYKAFEINHGLITVSNRSVLYGKNSCILLSYAVKLSNHLFIGYGNIGLLNLNVLILT